MPALGALTGVSVTAESSHAACPDGGTGSNAVRMNSGHVSGIELVFLVADSHRSLPCPRLDRDVENRPTQIFSLSALWISVSRLRVSVLMSDLWLAVSRRQHCRDAE